MIFDIDASTINDKYTSGKTPEEVDWMMKRSHPKTTEELNNTINQYCNRYGWDSDLNWIDVSSVTNMILMFAFNNHKFNGDISKWDMSHMTNVYKMFDHSSFNGDISNWDMHNVIYANEMFLNSKFNGDISKWAFNSNVFLKDMFKKCPLEMNPPEWYSHWIYQFAKEFNTDYWLAIS